MCMRDKNNEVMLDSIPGDAGGDPRENQREKAQKMRRQSDRLRLRLRLRLKFI
jgi:hypothetical protein